MGIDVFVVLRRAVYVMNMLETPLSIPPVTGFILFANDSAKLPSISILLVINS